MRINILVKWIQNTGLNGKMKILKFLLPIILLLASCTPENKSLPSKKEKQQVVKQEKTDTCINCNFSTHEYKRSMYNKPYLLKIIPLFNHQKNEYQSTILLTQQKDTILNKPITIDTLEQNFFQKETDTLKVNLKNWNLINIELSFIRAYNLYFHAIMQHKNNNDKDTVLFQIDYLRTVGKLFVNSKGKAFTK